MELKKKCFKCNEAKYLSEFYRHPKMPDGRVNKCKICNKSDVQKNYRKNIEHYIDYDKKRLRDPKRMEARREYQKTEGGKAAHLVANQSYRKRNREVQRAHSIVARAIARGKLNRQPCSVCGVTNYIEAHHPDYSRALEVVWLCEMHHKEHHWDHGGFYHGVWTEKYGKETR